MGIAISSPHVRRLIDQIVQNLVGLQRDLHANAIAWRSAASTQAVPVETLAGWLVDTAQAYQGRLDWVSTAQASTDTWTQTIAMWCAQGGQAGDIDGLVAPLQAIVTELAGASALSYTDVIAVCDQITAAVGMPPSLWPE